MFVKPYKLKSNNALKNSEKKHLVQRLQDEFPTATEEKIKEIVPAKSSCICMKLVLHSGDMLNVYAVDSVPMVIEMAEGLVPTVCAIWKVPELVPVLPIHTPVLAKVQGGAPVYLPGLETPAGGIGFPMFQRGAVIAMCTTDNAAAAIVGRAAISSADMLLRAAGVCLETLHVFGDHLCKDNRFGKIERPRLGAATYGATADSVTAQISQLSLQPVRDEWPALGAKSSPTVQAPAPNEPRLIADPTPVVSQNTEERQMEAEDSLIIEDSTGDSIPADMDGLLRWCLLSFLKLEGKRTELPLKTNLLYRNHLLPLCPPDRSLDVKKSSFKKLSKFLDAMQQEGLLEVRELEKGVDAVMALNVAHPLLRSHRVPTELPRRQVEERPATDYVPPLVREMLCVTAAVLELFAPLKKGTALTAAEVRSTLTEYVKSRSLNSTQVKGAVTLDSLLAKIVGKPVQEAVKWDALMSAVQSKMTASTEMQFPDGSVTLTKARLEPVTMQVATRSGNKKVTLVSNLEQFGFNLAALSHACQAGVAASCGVTRSPGAKADQLMLQGDQTHFIAKLLIEKYGLPKKFVEGADKALNKKK